MLVLKIIGIVLLSILALILLLIALVLFVPIRYEATVFADGTDLEKLRGHAKVHWLLHLASFGAVFENKQSKLFGRVAFFKLLGEKKEKEERPPKKDNKRKRQKDIEDEFFEDFPEDDVMEDFQHDEVMEQGLTEEPRESKDADREKAEDFSQEKAPKKDKERPKKKNSKAKKEKKAKKIKKPKNPNSLPKRLKRLYEKREKVARVFEKEKKNLHVALRRTGRILKKILPRKCKGYVEFGMADPATTGKILGYVSALYAMTGPILNLYPDFTEQKLKADVKLKGHFTLFSIGVYVLQVPFNKELRRAYRYLNKLSMEDSKEVTKEKTGDKKE